MDQTTRFELSQCRDVAVLQVTPEEYLLFACGSLGGVGSKPNDTCQVPADVAGYACARAAVMRILALGGTPMFLMNTLSVEVDPTGRRVIEGIRRQMDELGLDPSFALIGSTEESVPVEQTGIGVTAVGAAPVDGIGFATTQHLDAILCVGLPKSPPDDPLSFDDPEILKMSTLCRLVEHPAVHELMPVGSRGIGAELEDLMRQTDLALQYEKDIPVQLAKSAGPATCASGDRRRGRSGSGHPTARPAHTRPTSWPRGCRRRGPAPACRRAVLA